MYHGSGYIHADDDKFDLYTFDSYIHDDDDDKIDVYTLAISMLMMINLTSTPLIAIFMMMMMMIKLTYTPWLYPC